LFSDESLFLNTVYVYMTPENWYILWFVTVFLEFFGCHIIFHESTRENISDLVIL
jgi:hypothetical protein